VAAGTLSFPGLHPETVGATRRIAQAFLWMAALAAAYPYLPGSSSEAFKGLSLLLGVMVSLGSTGIMAQAMSGLVVVYSRALAAGDSIRAGEVEGVVSEVGLLSTKVITLRGEEVTLPNNVVIAGGVRNFSRLNRGEGALCTTTVTIGYDAPWRQVEALLIRAASGTHGLVAEVPAYVLQRSLSDFFVTYDLVARLENPIDRPQVLSELHGRIQDLFNEAGIQIMSPHFMVQPPAPVLARPAGAGPERPPRPPPVSG
jgi:small-conductance mechanosensitive channel